MALFFLQAAHGPAEQVIDLTQTGQWNSQMKMGVGHWGMAK